MNPDTHPHALPTTTRVAVIGAGTMGAGIAQVAAQAGHPVLLYDNRPDAAGQALADIAQQLQKRVEKGRQSSEDRAAILGRLQTSTTLSDLAGSGLVIEAIVEDLSIKQQVFGELEQLCSEDALFATNTSSLSVTALASGLKDPGRMAGMHFFNPAPAMKLCEIVSGLASRPEVVATMTDTALAWGKVAVQVASTPGFIVNRVARPFYTEAMKVYEEGGADIVTLDTVLKQAGRFPMGPFALTDLIGQDINLAVSQSVFASFFQDRRFEPSMVQKALVDAGYLGRKSGRGFYCYDGSDAPIAAPVTPTEVLPDSPIEVSGDPGTWAALLGRFENAGINITHTTKTAPGELWLNGVCLSLTDGRTATTLAESSGHSERVVFDLAHDYRSTDTLAVAAADQASKSALPLIAALFHRIGIQLYALDDVPGLIVQRTVCMLTNLAADAVHKGVCTVQDVDAAMVSGTGYPSGPLVWGQQLGYGNVRTVLLHLEQAYGDGRYRPSPWLQRSAVAKHA